jgi:hypothetical protein
VVGAATPGRHEPAVALRVDDDVDAQQRVDLDDGVETVCVAVLTALVAGVAGAVPVAVSVV